MKTLLVVLILGVAGWFAYRTLLNPPEKRSCHRLAELCGDKSGIDKCVSDLADLGKMNKEALVRLDSCVGEAKSCGEGTGCLVGAGLGAAGSMFNDFIKGLGKALPK